jgi:hypothetical protein
VVETRDATVQSILTFPIGNTSKLPSILFVQGWDCGSVEWPLPGQNLSRELVYGLTRAGFAVMRSEKSGVGDGTGTPCRDMDFRAEVSLFTSALKKAEDLRVRGHQQCLHLRTQCGWLGCAPGGGSRAGQRYCGLRDGGAAVRGVPC